MKGMASVQSAFESFPSSQQLWSTQEYSSFGEWYNATEEPSHPGVSMVLSSRILPASVLSDASSAAVIASSILETMNNDLVDLKIGLLLGGVASVDRYNDTSVSRFMREGLWHISGAGQWQDDNTSDRQQQNITLHVREFCNSLRALVCS